MLRIEELNQKQRELNKMVSFSDIHREKIDVIAMESRLDEKYLKLNLPLQD